MNSWFFSYWVNDYERKGPVILADFRGYYKTDSERYSTEADCLAAAAVFRLQTGNTDIQIHCRSRRGRSSRYKLGEK